MPIFTSQIKIDGDDYDRLVALALAQLRSPETIIGQWIQESIQAKLDAMKASFRA